MAKVRFNNRRQLGCDEEYSTSIASLPGNMLRLSRIKFKRVVFFVDFMSMTKNVVEHQLLIDYWYM